MRLDLKFAAGRMMGDGDDEVGYFVINGKYDAETGEAWWTKTYPGSHEVHYDGMRNPRGISGEWQIHAMWRGGFAIWPGESEEGPVERESEEVEAPEEVPSLPLPDRPLKAPRSRFHRVRLAPPQPRALYS
jgi:hypothetical protein